MMDEGIFAPISNLQRTEFIEAAYQVLRVLRHRTLSEATREEMLDFAGFEGLTDPNGSLRPYVDETLRGIEAAEHKVLPEISDGDLSRYRQTLFNLLFSRAKINLPGPRPSTAELLSRVS